MTRNPPGPSAREIPVVCAIIVDESGQVLACRRGPGRSLEGKWEFPGGKVGPGEIPTDALCREILEELGIVISIESALPVVRHDYPDWAIELIPFIARIKSGVLQPREHSSVKWLPLDQLASLDWSEADWPIVRHLSSRVSG